MSKPGIKTADRLETLDQLRGFFIVTIIIDHLSRFPSLFVVFSGKALLWVTAAEGFVSISGLLIGYVRGYKNRDQPFKQVAMKLLHRAWILYLWAFIASVTYIAIVWYIPLKGGFPSTPMPVGDWQAFLIAFVTLQYTWPWVYFLTLYALFLAAAPIAVWLFRRNLAWVVGAVSLLLLILGWVTDIEALQWQFMFFISSIIGLYLHAILTWWHARKQSTQIAIAASTVTLTVITVATSVIFTYYDQSFEAFADSVNSGIFAKDSISLARTGMAFLWFTGYMFIFYRFRHFIKKALNWLLIPVGTHSLTAYILHGLALCTISFFTVGGDNFWINTFLGIIAIMITWGLLRIPFVRRVIPA